MRHQLRKIKGETGFTLIEVIVVVAIIGIIAAIGIPGFSSWLPNYRLRLASQEILSNFQLAKTTAIKRNTNCTITFSVPSLGRYIGGVDCLYVVYVDSNRDLGFDTGEEIIRNRFGADYNDNISFDTDSGTQGTNFPNNDDNLPSVSFRSNGMPVTSDGAGGTVPGGGTVFLKNTNDRRMRITLSTAGSVTIE